MNEGAFVSGPLLVVIGERSVVSVKAGDFRRHACGLHRFNQTRFV